jgi:hypothetical protein
MWGAQSDERTGLSFARVTVSSSKSLASMCRIIAYSLPREMFAGPLPSNGCILLLVARWLERVYRAVA